MNLLLIKHQNLARIWIEILTACPLVPEAIQFSQLFCCSCIILQLPHSRAAVTIGNLLQGLIKFSLLSAIYPVHHRDNSHEFKQLEKALLQQRQCRQSVKPTGQEQTLIPLTMLFMPGQPELTFLTCLYRFRFSLPPRLSAGSQRSWQRVVPTYMRLPCVSWPPALNWISGFSRISFRASSKETDRTAREELDTLTLS